MNDYCQCEKPWPYQDEYEDGSTYWACDNEDCGKLIDPEPDWDAIGDAQMERRR